MTRLNTRSGRRKVKVRRKRLMGSFLLLLLFVVSFFGTYAVAKNIFFPSDNLVGITNLFNENEDIDPDKFKERTNFLLLGTDARKGEKITRTDTIILASIDKSTGKSVLVSIPRDTRVEIPGHGANKINAASVLGGVELTKKTVENLFGVPIDYHVLVKFDGFKDVVDALGGVTMDIEERMYHPDPEFPELTIDLKKGVQKLDGDKALQFVRYRNYALGDVTRTEMQQKFLKALADETLQPKTIARLPKLVPTILKCVETDLGLSDTLALANIARKFDAGNMVTQTLPGKFWDYNGGSYWQVDLGEARSLIANLYNGETSNVVLGSVQNSGSEQAKKDSTKDNANKDNKAEDNQKDKKKSEKDDLEREVEDPKDSKKNNSGSNESDDSRDNSRGDNSSGSGNQDSSQKDDGQNNSAGDGGVPPSSGSVPGEGNKTDPNDPQSSNGIKVIQNPDGSITYIPIN